jgi:hypothetical protein
MTVYGSRLYGSFKYGIASTTDISVYPFTTQSLDYGTINLSWIYPTPTANFTNFSIVRNPSGFPVTPDGGDLIFKTTKTALNTAGALGLEGTLTDTGSFYDPITGSITPTYRAFTAEDTNNSIYVNLYKDYYGNVITNGEFDVNTSGWAGGPSTTLSRVSSSGNPVYSGSYGLRASNSAFTSDDYWFATNSSFAMGPMQEIKASMWLYSGGATSSVKIQTVFYALNGDIVGSTISNPITLSGSSFTNAVFKTTTVANTVYVRLFVFAVKTASTPASIFADKITLEKLDYLNVRVGQKVSYVASGYLTEANAGSGVIGNTTVAAINGTSLTLSNAASIPAGTELTFTPTFLTPGKTYYYSAFVLSNNYWVRVGTALGTSIKNYNTADILYNLLPQVYRTPSSLDSENKNNDLYNFLRVIGVEYDLIKTKVENASSRYNIANVDGRLLPAMMDQMGFSYESGLGIQQSRRVLSNADYIYLNKGTGQGLKQFVTSFTGYPATIAPFKNLFLTLDCSSFEKSTGFWRAAGTALSVQLTTADEEGGSPAPYSEAASPTRYPNSQLGYLKAQVTSVAAGSNYVLRYGNSQDFAAITRGSNNSTAGFSFITITTDTEHGFSVGDTINLQDMAPIYINGIHEIVAVPDTKSFVFYDSSVTTSETIYPDGIAVAFLHDPTLYGIPVTAGTAYTFSIYSMADTTLRSISVGVLWYDKLGNLITDGATVNAVNNAVGSWTRIYNRNSTAPAYAAYADVYIRINSPADGEIHYFDAAQFEEAASETTYTDSRRVDVHLNSPRVNEVINPGFETDVSNWTVAGLSVSLASETGASNRYPTSAVGLGTAASSKSAKLTVLNSLTNFTSDTSIAVTAGKYYSLSAYVKGVDWYTATPSITWKNSLNEVIGTTTGTETTLSSNAFNRISLTALAPGATTTVNLISNPNFETNLLGWSAYIGLLSRVSFPSYIGSYSLKNSSGIIAIGSRYVVSTATSYAAVTPGLPYTASAYARGDFATNTIIGINWRNSSGTIISQPERSVATTSTTWTRLVLTETAPANAVFAEIVLSTLNVGGGDEGAYYDAVLLEQSDSASSYPLIATSADIKFTFTPSTTGSSISIYVDSVLFEQSDTVNAYFDGNTGYNVIEDLIWEQNSAGTAGTPSTGRSLYYPNRITTQNRLDAVLADYVPLGTSYAAIIGTTIS